MKKLYCLLWHGGTDGNIGYLLLRVFTGVALLSHGWPKLMAGVERWEGLGGVMGGIGVPGPAVFWGFMAAFAESIGAIMLAIGLLVPVAAFLIAVTMTVAAFVGHANDPFFLVNATQPGRAKELALLFLFIAILFMLKGAGRYSVDRFLPQKG